MQQVQKEGNRTGIKRVIMYSPFIKVKLIVLAGSEYTNRPNNINKDHQVVEFEVIKTFNPVRLSIIYPL